MGKVKRRKKEKGKGKEKRKRKKIKKKIKVFNYTKIKTPKRIYELGINDFLKNKYVFNKNYGKNIGKAIKTNFKRFGFEDKGVWKPSSDLKKHNEVFKLTRPELKYGSGTEKVLAYLYIYRLQNKMKLLVELKKRDKTINVSESDIANLFDTEKNKPRSAFDMLENENYSLKIFKKRK